MLKLSFNIKKGLSVLFFFLSSYAWAQDLLNYFPNTNGSVCAIEIDTLRNRLIIAGEFTQVNGVPRDNIAVLDLSTGSLLPFLYPFTGVSGDRITNVKLSGNKLFYSINVAGVSIEIYELDANTYEQLPNNYGSTSGFGGHYNINTFNNNILFEDNTAGSSGGIVEWDTISGSMVWNVTTSVMNTSNPFVRATCLYGDTLFVAGYFSQIGGQSRKSLAAINMNTHTILPWAPVIPTNCAGEVAYIEDITVIGSKLYVLTGHAACGLDSAWVYRIDIPTGTIENTVNLPGYGPFINSVYDIYAFNDSTFMLKGAINKTIGTYFHENYAKVNIVTGFSDEFNPDTLFCSYGSTYGYDEYDRKGNLFALGFYNNSCPPPNNRSFAVFCIPPKRPSIFTQSVNSVCVDNQSINFQVSPVSNVVDYIWTYSGTGVNLSSSGTSATLQFTTGAALGTHTLTVRTINSCGSHSDSLNLAITLYHTPVINSLPDSLLTCTRNSISLMGSSDIPAADASYQWKDPNNSTTVINPLSATVPGDYVLTATNTVSGCFKRDTVHLFIDTVRPVLAPIAASVSIPCAPNYVILSGASSNTHAAADSVWWQSPTNTVFANPLQTSTIGNYVFHAKDPYNGCEATDTVLVLNNATPPNISLPATVDTLTCVADSVLLNGSSSTPGSSLYWVQVATGDTIPNPFYADTIGAYKLVVVDNSNNCVSQGFVNVNQYITPPHISITQNSPSVNCSFSSASLIGNSLTPGAALLWTGPSSFSSANPATTGTAGNYTLTVTNPANGCIKTDSITVVQQNVLITTASADTVICNGTSAIVSIVPVGGTAPFFYTWNNSGGTSQSAIVSPVNDTYFYGTITDNNGCTGSDSVLVRVPSLINDSTLSFQPCDTTNPNGQIQVFAYGGIPPYQYSIDNGISFQSSQVFTNLNYGSYAVVINDSLGCSYSHGVVINQLSNTPHADFIVNTSMLQGDTFVVVDISNPRPDTVIWTFPSFVQVINSDPFNPVVVASDTGMFTIDMEAHFGSCVIHFTKNVQFIKPDTALANANNNNGIESISVSPNPNSGQFTLEIKFYKKQSFVASIINSTGAEVFRQTGYETNYFTTPVNIVGAANGTYYIKVVAEYDAETRTFIINN